MACQLEQLRQRCRTDTKKWGAKVRVVRLRYIKEELLKRATRQRFPAVGLSGDLCAAAAAAAVCFHYPGKRATGGGGGGIVGKVAWPGGLPGDRPRKASFNSTVRPFSLV